MELVIVAETTSSESFQRMERSLCWPVSLATWFSLGNSVLSASILFGCFFERICQFCCNVFVGLRILLATTKEETNKDIDYKVRIRGKNLLLKSSCCLYSLPVQLKDLLGVFEEVS